MLSFSISLSAGYEIPLASPNNIKMFKNFPIKWMEK
jgi:hypothetical protein